MDTLQVYFGRQRSVGTVLTSGNSTRSTGGNMTAEMTLRRLEMVRNLWMRKFSLVQGSSSFLHPDCQWT